MLIQSDEDGPFVTLLAHAPYPELQIHNLQKLFGNSLVLCCTHQESKAEITSKLFNLIIIDLSVNGFDLIYYVKTLSCINRQTPIIALVDNLDSCLRKSVIEAGFDDCLLKPLTTDNLVKTMKFWGCSDVLTSFFLSIQTLLVKCRGNRELVLKLYMKLFEELPLQLNQIEDALKTGQYTLAFEVTHKLNGSAKICCLHDIEPMIITLEECLINGEYTVSQKHFWILHQRISTLLNHRQSIKNHLNQNILDI